MKLLVATFLFLNVISSNLYAQPVKEYGQLKVEGTLIVDENSNPIVLRGMSYGWHNWWPRFYNEGTVKWLAEDWECTVLRAAMGVEPDTAYLTDSANSVEKISAVVDAAIKQGIYVLIDWHSHELNVDAAKAFFGMMAEKYGEYPNVIYEIYNEPIDDTWEEVKAYSIEVITSIRSFDPDNIILVGCPHWGQDIHLVADNPIEDQSNILYTIHFYAGTHTKWLRERGDYALEKGIPIFVSECASMEANGDGPLDYKEWGRWIKWMEKKQISWICWSIADKNESCSVLNSTADSEGNWKDEDLKEWGKLSRKTIKELNE